MEELEIVFDPLPTEALSRLMVDQLVAHNLAATGLSTYYPPGRAKFFMHERLAAAPT
jgi:hypothetical protein